MGLPSPQVWLGHKATVFWSGLGSNFEPHQSCCPGLGYKQQQHPRGMTTHQLKCTFSHIYLSAQVNNKTPAARPFRGPHGPIPSGLVPAFFQSKYKSDDTGEGCPMRVSSDTLARLLLTCYGRGPVLDVSISALRDSELRRAARTLAWM